MPKRLRIGIIGGGMFFDDIIGQSFKDFKRGGFAGALNSIGMSHFAPKVADIEVDFCAIGTRSAKRGTADAIRNDFLTEFPDADLRALYGDDVWRQMLNECDLDILFVASPDHLHFPAIMDALSAGVDVITEKPMCLKTSEADEIISKASAENLVVAVDMHKRYDPFVRDMMTHSLPRYDRINRVRAALEEPLEVSTEIFAWAEQSNPFAYVGCHWLDVISHYMKVKPRAVYATGEKNLLVNWDRYVQKMAQLKGRDLSSFSKHNKINAWDAMNVNVTYDNGMRGDYNNNWINPEEFEGAVNQELEVYGILGRGFVDQQDRGFRETITGDGSRTRNPTFGGRIRLPSHTELFGYGKASIVAGLLAVARRRFENAALEELQGTYPDAESQHSTTMIIEAATRVAELNYDYLEKRGCAPVSAALSGTSISLLDPVGDHNNEIVYSTKI